MSTSPKVQRPTSNVQRPTSNRRGAILLIVLVVTVFLTLAAYAYTDLMLGENRSVEMNGRAAQARALANSGLDFAVHFLTLEPETQLQFGGMYDNSQRFRRVPVLEADLPREAGYFTIAAAAVQEDGWFAEYPRSGLEDESTRLNLNVLLLADEQQENGGRKLLMELPLMTEDVADAILDFIDEDDEPREFGAEIETYSAKEPPYKPMNGPLASLEDLLLVEGVTPELLFGPQYGLGGTGEGAAVLDSGEGDMSRGWAGYLTLYSAEKNATPEGDPRIDLNNENLEELYDQLAEALNSDWAKFIVAYRQNGPYTGSETPTNNFGGSIDFDIEPQTQFSTILDLIGPHVQVRYKGQEEATLLKSPFPDPEEDPVAVKTYLPLLMDNLAVNVQPTIPGRININQCSEAVLKGVMSVIPEIEENRQIELVTQILGDREMDRTDLNSPQRHETWLLSDGVVNLEEMKALLPFVCAGGHVYRGEIYGHFGEGGPAARIEAVIDASGKAPRLLFWRDKSHLGVRMADLGVEAGE